MGDRLLIAVARRLESAVRPPDTVARLGGDEFTVLLDGVSDVHEAAAVAERVQHTLRTPFDIDDRELHIDASIGIALADAGAAPDTVLRDADVAMYRAKADGKGRHAVFDGRMHEQVMRRLDMEAELRQGDRGAAARGRLPADRAGGDRAHRRLRGALPLARARRLRRAVGVRPDRRGDRPDRAARPLGAAHRVRPARRVARAARRAPACS